MADIIKKIYIRIFSPFDSYIDPSLPAGKRKEIDNVMKKARASSNDYWDKKLLEVEEKDPNRWRHTGYKKMYIEGDSSSESDRGDRDGFRYNNRYRSRSRSHSRPRANRRTPPSSPPLRRRPSPPEMRRISPDMRRPRSPDGRRPPRSPELRRRPRSPPEPPMGGPGRRVSSGDGRKSPRSPRSPIDSRRRSPSSPGSRRRSPLSLQSGKRGIILPRSKRPPSPPPKVS